MNQELYNKLFARMDSLGAIRKDLSFGCEVSWLPTTHESSTRFKMKIDTIHHYDNESLYREAFGYSDEVLMKCEVVGHPPILSDCILWYEEALQRNPFEKNTVLDIDNLLREWELSKPYLHQQSDELWDKLFELLK